jgi:hypothetical protein
MSIPSHHQIPLLTKYKAEVKKGKYTEWENAERKHTTKERTLIERRLLKKRDSGMANEQ